MWFKSIDARAFGPFVDRHLPFETGLNVVHGPNESGKSTLHAALTAALCGLRRRRGRDPAREKFTARYRPWGTADGDPWRVKTEVVLDDGRCIAIERDFKNGTTEAYHADMGREFSELPMNEGSEDAAKLVGLDRETFPMTASVRQASIVSDLGNPDALQQHLARAAAGGTGGTAAGAIKKIEAYKRDQVGLDRPNTTKPLRKSRMGVEGAQQRLATVKEAHQAYLRRVSELEAHRRRAMTLEGEKKTAEAQRDYRAAKDKEDQLAAAAKRIDEWQARFSAGDPSQGELLGPVELYEALVRVESLPGPASTTLAEVQDLERQLNELNSDVELPCPELLEVQKCVAPLRRLDSPERGEARGAAPLVKVVIPALVVAAVLAVAVGISFGVGVGLSAAVAGGTVAALASRAVQRTKYGDASRASRPPGGASESAAHDEAVRRLSEWCLPLGPDDAVHEASRRLQARTERSACRNRLVQDLQRRRDFDNTETCRQHRHEEAWTKLRGLALVHGVEGSDEEVRRSVQTLLDAHEEAQRRRDDDVEEWGRYQQALAGREPRDWHDDASAARTEMSDCYRRLRELGVEPTDPSPEMSEFEAKVADLDRAIREASGEAKLVEGELSHIDQESVDVAAVEARLRGAEAELRRVERLADTLDDTRDFLERAAENAHQLLAPTLGAEMTRWIPQITSGRYREVQVDPGDLNVTLVTAAGDRRPARLVSRGTTEQAYLVLRLVLAQVLSADHETCPVLLDDPTVHADSTRKTEILDYLLAASREHQVIVFSQEQEVLDWVKNQPDGAVHLIELAGPQPA